MYRLLHTICLRGIAKRPYHNTSSSVEFNVDSSDFYRSVTLNRKRYEHATDILHRNSFPAEDVRKPFAVGLNFLDVCGEILPCCFEESASRICYDAQIDQPIGVIINRLGKGKDLWLPSFSIVYPGAKAISTSLRVLGQQITKFHPDDATSGLQILYLGVLEAHRGKGVGRRLVSETLDFARDSGAGFVQTYTTSLEVESLFHGLGFETLGKLRLMDHFVDGSLAFPNATGGDELSYMAKFL